MLHAIFFFQQVLAGNFFSKSPIPPPQELNGRPLRLLSVDEVMWCRQQSVNHQGLLCSLHCATTVVLREQLNFKSAVIRSERSSCLSEILPGQLLRLYLNFYEYEMLIERELCLYFSAFLNNCQQPASE